MSLAEENVRLLAALRSIRDDIAEEAVTRGGSSRGDDAEARLARLDDALSGGTAALEAAVAKAVASERARIRADAKAMIERDYLYIGGKVSDLIESILREIGGA